MKKELINGVIYARYSPGPNQTDQSIEGQVHDCEEYARRNNIRIVKIYADRHLSGKDSVHRNEFQQMLRDAESQQFSTVITWKIDRFGRNREEIALNKYRLRKSGVSVRYALENIPTGPEGIILESMLEGMAEYYSAELAQKIRRGQRESVAKGRILCAKGTYGYKKDKDLHFVIDEPAAAVVLEIFQQYADGMMQKDIISLLNSKSIKKADGRPFTPNAIRRLLSNRQYIGEYRYGDNVNMDAIPPIVPVELFNTVQERLVSTSKTKAASQARSTVNYLLSGTISCAECGSYYQGESGTGRHGERHYYYKCHGKKNHKTVCHSKNFSKAWLEDFVVQHTVEDVLTDDMISLIADRVVELQQADSISYAIHALEAQLASCTKKLNNLLAAIEEGIVTPTTKERLLALETEKDELSVALSGEKLKRVPFTRDHVIYWLELFRAGDINSFAFREKLIHTFINHIVIDDDMMFIAYNVSGKEACVPLNSVIEGVRLRSRLVD